MTNWNGGAMNETTLSNFMDELEDLLKKYGATISPLFDQSRDMHVLEIEVEVEEGVYVSTTRSIL